MVSYDVSFKAFSEIRTFWSASSWTKPFNVKGINILSHTAFEYKYVFFLFSFFFLLPCNFDLSDLCEKASSLRSPKENISFCYTHLPSAIVLINLIIFLINSFTVFYCCHQFLIQFIYHQYYNLSKLSPMSLLQQRNRINNLNTTIVSISFIVTNYFITGWSFDTFAFGKGVVKEALNKIIAIFW